MSLLPFINIAIHLEAIICSINLSFLKFMYQIMVFSFKYFWFLSLCNHNSNCLLKTFNTLRIKMCIIRRLMITNSSYD